MRCSLLAVLIFIIVFPDAVKGQSRLELSVPEPNREDGEGGEIKEAFLKW